MLATLFLDIFMVALVIGGVQFYIEAHIGIVLTTPVYPSAPKGELDPDRW